VEFVKGAVIKKKLSFISGDNWLQNVSLFCLCDIKTSSDLVCVHIIWSLDYKILEKVP